MSEPLKIAVDVGTLRLLHAQARAGETPRIAWQDRREAMIAAAMEARRNALKEIGDTLEEILGNHLDA